MAEKPSVYPFRREKETSDLGSRHSSNIFNLEEMAKEALTKKQPIQKDNFWDENKIFTLGNFTLVDGAVFLAAFLLAQGQVLGEFYPFGVAFLSAAMVKYRKHSGVVLVFLALGALIALGQNSLAYIVAMLCLAGLLYFTPRDTKRDVVVVPAVTLASLVAVRAVFLLFDGDISAYSMMVVIFEGMFAAGLALVMLVVFGLINDFYEIKSLSTDELVCVFVVLLGCICGLGDLSIGDIAVRDVFSRFLVMLAAFWGGAGSGAGVGALMGILPSMNLEASPATIGLYAFAGLLAGTFKSFGRLGVAIGFTLGNVMLGLYVVSVEEIAMHLTSTLVAIMLLVLVPAGVLKRGEKIFAGVSLRTVEEEKNRRLLRLSARRLKSAAWIFRDLSNGCRVEAAKEAQEEAQEKNVEMVLNHLCNQVCHRCSIQQLCWTIDFNETYRGVMGLFNVAEEKGFAESKDAPLNFQKRCPHIQELVATINCLYELYCQNNYWQSQRAGSRIFLAGQLDGTAQVLENLSKEMTDGDRDTRLIEKTLARAYGKAGVPISGVQVSHLGDKNIDFWLNVDECPGEVACRDLAAREISKMFQCKFKTSETSCGNNCGVGCCFHMLKEGAGMVHIGKAQLAKDGTAVCGDSGDTVTLGEGRQLLMLSDGMGSGISASLKSGSAINMLSRLLEVGFDRYTAIDTVNTILMLQGGDEAFVTLDMCIIDQYENTAEFIKTGAAPSFIKRGDEVKVIKNASLPVGMLQTVDKSVQTEALCNGDMVILASDGLLDAISQIDISWLVNLLEDSDLEDSQEMAEFLLNKAIGICGGRLKDDITILVATVEVA